MDKKQSSDNGDHADGSIEKIYKSRTDWEMIIKSPGMYIGSVDLQTETMFTYHEDDERISTEEVEFPPGLYKIFDEVLVNARDESVRNKKCDSISIKISDDGWIEVKNNGSGIPVKMHKVEKMWVPQMIFGKLRTSSNYDKKGKNVGGRNGYGAKLANVFSTEFEVETVDDEGTFFQIKWSDNMLKHSEPKIKKNHDQCKTPYTLIRFHPDYKRFEMDGLTDQVTNLFRRRAYDLAGTAAKKLKVSYNGEAIPIKSFREYISRHYPADAKPKLVYEDVSSRWSVGVVYDPEAGHQHISFVNGINTYYGGTHVDHVISQIKAKLTTMIQKKHKGMKIKPSQILDNITIFVNAVIDDPDFTSQVKERLSTKPLYFGGKVDDIAEGKSAKEKKAAEEIRAKKQKKLANAAKCDLSDKFFASLAKTGLFDEIVAFAQMKEQEQLKKTDGKKNRGVLDIIKLEDANWAGKKRSAECKLFLTEGDSAKAFAVGGLAVIGNDRYGVFPLKGKLLNVRDASVKKLVNNKEISEIKRILGLQHGKKYTDRKQLRYGGIIIMADQDHDGSHIKGLIINFFEHFWPELLEFDDFIQCLATPLMKAFKGTGAKEKVVIFYNNSEFNAWKKDNPTGWQIAYYKGLGSSEKTEVREAFKGFDKRLISYVKSKDPTKDEKSEDDTSSDSSDSSDSDSSDSDSSDSDDSSDSSDSSDDSDSDSDSDDGYSSTGNRKKGKPDPTSEALRLAFDKKLADMRKKWLQNYDKDDVLENSQKTVSYHDFINRELIHFSNADLIRSIPNVIDGLKPSQRKILWTVMKLNLNTRAKAVKVAQLAGSVGELSAYHHGEASLQGAIVNMGQDYCGTNNINPLYPKGQFGSRMNGGEDAASPRYIHTYMESILPLIFRKEDAPVLTYMEDDGQMVEPEYYVPVIPMQIVNGADGIGTGYSTSIPCYNPKDIIRNIRRKLDGKEFKPMDPWYWDFKGKITQINDKKYEVSGNFKIIDENTIHITELPLGLWNTTYKEFIVSKLMDGKDPLVDTYTMRASDVEADVILYFNKGKLKKYSKNIEALMKKLKLIRTINLTNMHAYNTKMQIQKYHSAHDIMSEFYKTRLTFYEKRKAWDLKIKDREIKFLNWKIKFIEDYLSRKIVIAEERKGKFVHRTKADVIEQLHEMGFPELRENIRDDKSRKSYNYLTEIRLFDLTEEEIEKLRKEHEQCVKTYSRLEKTTCEDMWRVELEELSEAYDKWIEVKEARFEKLRERVDSEGEGIKKPKGAVKGKAKAKATKKGRAKAGKGKAKAAKKKSSKK